ncbi:MAG: hypothetical protein K2L99_03230, partial [Muribaculaceae bacterium]|nr:hypothetical protein [Muribaculaceae bacterium]
MIKRLLFSAMAAAAVAFSASADTYSLMSVMGSGGWGSSYDKDTKTITFEDEWKGRGVWFGNPGFDASDYDELVFECEATDMSFNLVVQYNGYDTNSSANFPAGSTKAIVSLDPDHKNDIQQVYVQGTEAGTIVVKDLYFQNEVEVDPTIPVVIFEGNKEFPSDWSVSVDIPAAQLSMAKFAAGDKLVFEYTAEESNGFKIIYVNSEWSWELMPIMSTLVDYGYSEQYGTINLPADKHEFAITFDAENVDLLMNSDNHGGKVQGAGFTLTKISVVHAAAAAEASNWFISGQFNNWDHGKTADYAFVTTATDGVYEVAIY